jgi:hypothetical protein
VRSIILPALAAALLTLAACGGSGNSSSDLSIASPTTNVAAVTVNAGPANNALNTAYVSVTVCNSSSTGADAGDCETINNIQVDTGSYGLRILASALNLSLPAVNDPATGSPLVECTQFSIGYVWGPVVSGVVELAQEETEAAVPIQIIGAASYPASTIPTDCSSTGGQLQDTVATFGANGILGVGPFVQDCGNACATSPTPIPATYYVCPTPTTCTNTDASVDNQVSNPVASFTTDANGIILELPTLSASGAASVTGSLVFGIGTQTNNGISTTNILDIDPNSAYITAVSGGKTLTDSFIDSGSNAFLFDVPALTQCQGADAGFLCPADTTAVDLTLYGQDAMADDLTTPAATATLSIANADTLFNANPNSNAFDNVAATNPDASSFDLGLPFFFGRDVYYAIDGETTSSGPGPYVAF